jgi:hypothetical protein
MEVAGLNQIVIFNGIYCESENELGTLTTL